eukprot:939468-Pyramimonas_sp.AAC.1
MLGELELKVNKSQKGVPDKLVAMRYYSTFTDLRKEWEGYKKCRLDIYAKGHAEYSYFSAMSGLLIVRIHFLE